MTERQVGTQSGAPHVVGAASRPATQLLDRPGGRLAYDDTGGTGPLVVALPGLGDLRASYRFLAPPLAVAGFRVVTSDLRGMGESSAGWNDYSAMAVGDDVQALIRHLGAGPAFVLGNSHGGGAAVWAAARAPDLVRSLVLLDPFVHDPQFGPPMRAALKLALAGPWGAAGWLALFDREFAAKPADYAAYRAALARNLRQPGRMDSVRGMFWAGKSPIEARLPDVQQPALVLMGGKDPDFADPAAEALDVAGRLRGVAHVIDGAGHYPHVERPDEVTPLVIDFLRSSPEFPATAR